MQGRIIDFHPQFGTNKQILTLELSDDFKSFYDCLKDAELDIEIKKHYKKRKLTANAYMWILIGKLAAKLNVSTEEIYSEYVRDYGVYDIIPIRDDAVDRFIESWEKKDKYSLGGWKAVPMQRDSKIEGYTNIVCYHGTSVYRQDEFGRLLKQIVDDCKLQGIETKNPHEIERLVEAYFG